MNNQIPLKTQLDHLENLAVKAGLYDAYSWLRSKRFISEVEDHPYELGLLHGGQGRFDCPYPENSKEEDDYCRGYDGK